MHTHADGKVACSVTHSNGLVQQLAALNVSGAQHGERRSRLVLALLPELGEPCCHGRDRVHHGHGAATSQLGSMHASHIVIGAVGLIHPCCARSNVLELLLQLAYLFMAPSPR